MWPYWVLFFLPVLGFFVARRLSVRSAEFFLFFVCFFFVVFVGLRHETGGDWFNYIRSFDEDSALSFFSIILGGDPGYHLLAAISSRIGGSLHLVNFVCASILMLGVYCFARHQPLPWMALVVSVPYLIIVVGMGYTRQSAALGFLLIGLVFLMEKRLFYFVFFVLVGASFHKSAVLLLPVAALSSSQRRVWSFFWIGVTSLLAAYFFVYDSVGKLWENYVEADYQSQGGLVRVLMNLVPAVIFLVFRKKMGIASSEDRLWFWMSVLAVCCLPLVVLSSTATDRLALYLIPIQLYVFSRLHRISISPYIRACVVLAVIFYYALVQLIWLLFAYNAFRWLPYQMYPFAS